MRLFVGLFLGLFVAVPSAWGAGVDTTASRVFAAVSPSIVVVEAFDKNGHAIAQGSGVVIAKGVVVSNCHVFEEAGTKSASIIYRNKQLPAELRYGDPDHDLCSFTVEGLTAPSVQMGTTSALKVGEDAYAIGAPEGLDLTLSNGIVSSLRKIPGGVVIQTTAPISPGSSGGGLFDSQGRLIGITSYYEKEGQQLNFALPVEWIEKLPEHATLRTVKKDDGKFLLVPAYSDLLPRDADLLHRAVQAELSGDYATALSIFKQLAEHGDAEAQTRLAAMYSSGAGVPQDYAKALYWYRKAAAQENVFAQTALGVMYAKGQGAPQDYAKAVYWYRKAAVHRYGSSYAWDSLGEMYYNGQGVPQNYTKAAYWYRKAAAQGFSDAKYLLGQMYREGRGVPQDYAKAVYWFQKAAAQGDADGQTGIGFMYKNGQGVPQNYAKAAYWYRKAAEQGNAYAQGALGFLYTLGQGVTKNYIQALKWFILAKAKGEPVKLSLVESEMTSTQISEAQRLANQWWEAHHKQ